MAALRVYGTVGKATVGIMTDAILRSAPATTDSTVAAGVDPAALVLLDADEQGLHALTTSGEEIAVVANGDLVSASRLPASAITFGLGRASTLWASDLDATLEGTRFILNSGAGQHRVQLQLLGEHQVMNALAALGVARAAGIPQDVAITALEGIATLGRGRMQRTDAPGDLIVINDAVSAQPQSVVAALKALVQVAGQRRSVAVLGELSLATDDAEEARAAHDRIGRLVVRLNVKKLVVVGQGARHIHNAAGLEGSWDGESVLVDTTTEAYDLLRDELRPQDVVLVKSSESSSLDALAERLSGALR
jgi:UDP-N-acetylmuramoyl-tripeptide--D-alanyl-D-alanine ligase